MWQGSRSFVSKRLETASPGAFSLYCIVAAFGTYFCMYAFRKPFTAGTYEATVFWGGSLKTLLLTAQVCGYTVSKFIGIKFVSELAPRYRAVAILSLIAISEIALLLFAVTPSPWCAVWLFVNGVPLGMVFGLVLGFLEGRRMTEALSAGLCSSIILSSGVVKSVGRTLIQDWGVSENWMPFVSGLIFTVPLVVAVWLLAQIPPPTASDVRLRTERKPMYREQRHSFFRRHAVGLVGLLFIYVLLTIGRSIRDDFAVEVWRDLGVVEDTEVFARSEMWVMVIVLILNSFVCMVRNNRKAFMGSLALTAVGFVIVLVAVVGHLRGWTSPMVFMVLLGIGMYIPYVTFHTTLFERMIAAFREVGTIGYLMYLADAIGYLAYLIIVILRNTLLDDANFLRLMIGVSVAIAMASLLAICGVSMHYHRRIPKEGDMLEE